MKVPFKPALFATTLGLAISAAPAHALTYLGFFDGNECGAGGFENCFATQTGTSGSGANGPGSPTIYKIGSDDEEDFGNYATINGNEFDVTLNGGTNTLEFTYTPGAGDPEVHYVAVKQSRWFALFYDAAPITSGSIGLTPYFPNNPGFSHITFFNTGTPVVPEPSTWAMMLIGFAGVGAMLRRRRKTYGGMNGAMLPQLA